MRDAEQAIEQVLAGLREAEIPQGMEGRILRAVEERSSERSLRKPWHISVKMPEYARFTVGSAVVASFLLVLLVIPAMRKPSHLNLDELGIGRNTIPVSSVHKAAGGVTHIFQTVHGPADECSMQTISAVLYEQNEAFILSAACSHNPPLVRKSEGVTSPQEESRVDGIPDYDALAVSEMLASSKPAPPLPLTHQERLLAQVVHKGEPEALATLQPDVRAKEMEISKAEFQNFFDPLPVKDNE